VIQSVSHVAHKPVNRNPSNPIKNSSNPSFQTLLQQQIDEKSSPTPSQISPPSQPSQTINFSKHAIARAAQRGMALTPSLMDKLADSVERAQEKGVTNILAFDSTQAFIINVPYGRVITTLSQDEMKENFFTNIDGAVIL